MTELHKKNWMPVSATCMTSSFLSDAYEISAFLSSQYSLFLSFE
ncbi:MAG: WPE palindromic element domain-containing protein [Wolbachia sp.]